MSDLLAKALHEAGIACHELGCHECRHPAQAHALDAERLRNHPDHARIAAEMLTVEDVARVMTDIEDRRVGGRYPHLGRKSDIARFAAAILAALSGEHSDD